jgi:RimJ/RimL family protein N-acetyltransferase
MIRPLTQADTEAAGRLLRLRPIHNVFLDHVVRSGAIGSFPGFLGHISGDRLDGIALIGPGGGTSLAATAPDACSALGAAAAESPMSPRHIVGPEEFTVPFWRGYAPFAPAVLWERREPVYVVARRTLCVTDRGSKLLAATESDLDQVVANSAEQYREDLHDDRFSQAPELFRERHRRDVLQHRWWILTENGSVIFQVHVGPDNDRVVQIGGVFTVPDRRNQGLATRCVSAIADRLLAHRPAVSLFCDEANRAARRAYERVGFRPCFYYRSWLLDA